MSDTHLGYENRVKTGNGKTVDWVSEISSCDAFDQLSQIAIARDVDAVIHTSDFLDHVVDAETLAVAEGCLERLSNHGIPVYCILGTHDHGLGDKQYRDGVDRVVWLQEQVEKRFVTELTTTPTLVAGGTLNAYGISAGNISLDEVRTTKPRGWSPSEIAFGVSTSHLNVLCLHDRVTSYRRSDGAIDLDRLLAQSPVTFDCVLIGDEHGPKNKDFESGYAFESQNGTPVLYTGPAIRSGRAYRDSDVFVTELDISEHGVSPTQHFL